MAKVKAYKLKWLFGYLNFIFTIGMPYDQEGRKLVDRKVLKVLIGLSM
jgi:hypothetical protein